MFRTEFFTVECNGRLYFIAICIVGKYIKGRLWAFNCSSVGKRCIEIDNCSLRLSAERRGGAYRQQGKR